MDQKMEQLISFPIHPIFVPPIGVRFPSVLAAAAYRRYVLAHIPVKLVRLCRILGGLRSCGPQFEGTDSWVKLYTSPIFFGYRWVLVPSSSLYHLYREIPREIGRSSQEHLAHNAVETYSWDEAKQRIDVHYRPGWRSWMLMMDAVDLKILV